MRGRKPEWTEQACVAAIREWSAEHSGRMPAMQELQDARPGRPCAQTVANVCGGWNRAVELAGFSPRKPVGGRAA